MHGLTELYYRPSTYDNMHVKYVSIQSIYVFMLILYSLDPK